MSGAEAVPVAVLIVGLDPALIPGVDSELIASGLAYGLSRFEGTGFVADQCLVALDDSAETAIAAALGSRDYACVVVGGGIRKSEALLPFFEAVINLVHRLAPNAMIAFNADGGDSLDAVRRVLALRG